MMSPDDKLDLIKTLHSKYSLYQGCEHDNDEDAPEFHEGRPVIFIEDVGYTCEDPPYKVVCHECHLDGDEPNECTDDYEWPCDTMKIVLQGEKE